MEKNAIIFPGQGAQYPKMGLSLYENFKEAKKIFDTVDEISGIKVSRAIFDSEDAGLKDTSIQQLAILTVSLAAYQQAKDKIGGVEFFSGLSLGEYSCLYAAEVLCLEDLILLVKKRGEAMQKAARENSSTMFAVIGAERKALEESSLDFYISNLNSPGQIVISLASKDKDKVRIELEEKGFRVIELKVSGGFHSPFMNPARDGLKSIVDSLQFSDAKIPIVSNVTAGGHTAASEIKENLLNQLISPVLWWDSVNYMAEKGVDRFYEIGPSKVLKGLIRKIDRKLTVTNVEKKEDLENI